MTDNEIIKTTEGENYASEKIKAIYPHIVVDGNIDKPYYSICYYDVEKQEWYSGYSSYNLAIVLKWLKECFDVVEADIGDLINRQKAEIEALISGQETLQRHMNTEISKAVKEFAERLCKDRVSNDPVVIAVKVELEMVADSDE